VGICQGSWEESVKYGRGQEGVAAIGSCVSWPIGSFHLVQAMKRLLVLNRRPHDSRLASGLAEGNDNGSSQHAGKPRSPSSHTEGLARVREPRHPGPTSARATSTTIPLERYFRDRGVTNPLRGDLAYPEAIIGRAMTGINVAGARLRPPRAQNPA